jgi:SAM-dependent methyltransferase
MSARRSRRTLAERADRYRLYETSVQDIPAEFEFIRNTFLSHRGIAPRTLREDFAGLGSLACRWARQGPGFDATAVDLDPHVLAVGRRRGLARLRPSERRRVHWLCADVLKARTFPADVTTAFNFSYWTFKTRPLLRRYFQGVYRGLTRRGLFIADAFGGYEACQVMRESRRMGSFTYVWEQAEYFPVTGDLLCHIHFRFPDRSRLERAFSYDWRLWTLPELRELLEEVGFRRTTVYWEGTDRHGNGNGEFVAEARGAADAGWIAYLVAEK